MPIVGGLVYAAAEGIGVATETAVGLAVAAEGVTWLPVAYGAYKVATGDYSAHDKSVSLSDAASIKSEGISNNMPDNLRGAKRQRVHLTEFISVTYRMHQSWDTRWWAQTISMCCPIMWTTASLRAFHSTKSTPSA